MTSIPTRFLLIALGLLLASLSPSRAQLLGFEFNGGPNDLGGPAPATDGRSGLQYVNGNNGSLYGGVVWDTRITVVGADSRVDSTTPGPLYSLGAPQGGSYYITNGTDDPTFGNGITLTTNKVLTGAWFGAVQFYGYNDVGGTTGITIDAMSGSTVLGSVSHTFTASLEQDPDTNLYIGEAMDFVDTSSFSSLTGITGYVINRDDTPSYAGNASWAADNFTFAAPQSVPEPSSWALALLVTALLGGCVWFRNKAQV